MYHIDTTKLTSHIISTVSEGLLKLGTSGNESYSIYYDLDLLNYLLQSHYESKELCLKDLLTVYGPEKDTNAISDTANIRILVSLEKGRFRFTIPASSIPVILSLEDKNSFLKDLIELVKSHHFTIDDVKQVFSKYSDDYTCEKTSHPEFSHVLYFNHKDINQYKYCFTFDGYCGGYYHRLLDYDYQKLLQEERE